MHLDYKGSEYQGSTVLKVNSKMPTVFNLKKAKRLNEET